MTFLSKLFSKTEEEPVVGGIYITKREAKNYPYTACKILHADEGVVSIMMYRNCFKEFPTELDISTLSIASPMTPEEIEKTFSGDSDMRLGVGCVPIDRQGFFVDNPKLIATTEVEDWERGFYNSMIESMGDSRTSFTS